MKICFATYPGVTITRGGPYVKIRDLKSSLEKKEVDVGLFDLWEAGEKLKEYDLFHIFGGNFAIYDLARHLKSHKIKFVVNPIIFSKHSSAVVKTTIKADRLLKNVVNGIRFDYGYTKDICDWSEMVLPNTQAEGELIAEGLSVSKEKIKVIHNGVSERFLSGNSELFKGKYGVDNFILSVGHLGPKRKNGLAFVKALSEIDCPSVIIGKVLDADEGLKIKKEIKRNNNIIFIDGLPNESPELISAYYSCKTFVLPSLYETPGRAALEAALTGTNVVITPYGGTKEYFGDMVEYVDPYSVESIKAAIIKSLKKTKTNNLRQHVANNFLWDKIADNTIKVYDKVLNE